MDYELEEDPEPTLLIKQREDSLLAEIAYNINKKITYKKSKQRLLKAVLMKKTSTFRFSTL